MNSVAIGSLELARGVPRLAAIVDRALPVDQLQHLKGQGVDFFEIRGDCFPQELDPFVDYVASVKASVGLPLLGTIKETLENRGHRLAWYRVIMPHLDAVDTDVDGDDAAELIGMATEQDGTVIVSWHDFEGTPSNARLDDTVSRAAAMGAHIVKLATTATCQDDVIRMLAFTHRCPENLVTIVMGATGTLARVAAPLYGSLFCFGFIGDAVAPGQLSVEEMLSELQRYYPDYAREKGK